MPKRIPMQTVIVQRDGKQVAPPIGKAFEFTREELDQIKAVAPDAIRHPVNEEEAEAPESQDKPVQSKSAPETATNAPRGKKASYLSGRDGDRSRGSSDL